MTLALIRSLILTGFMPEVLIDDSGYCLAGDSHTENTGNVTFDRLPHLHFGFTKHERLCLFNKSSYRAAVLGVKRQAVYSESGKAYCTFQRGVRFDRKLKRPWI